MISGGAWGLPDGPAVVTWREADGLVIRVLGMQVDLQTMQNAAAATRELTRSEWVALVENKSECPEPAAPWIGRLWLDGERGTEPNAARRRNARGELAAQPIGTCGQLFG